MYDSDTCVRSWDKKKVRAVECGILARTTLTLYTKQWAFKTFISLILIHTYEADADVSEVSMRNSEKKVIKMHKW